MSRVEIKGIHKVKTKGKNGIVREYHRLGRGRDSITFWKSTDGFAEGSEQYFKAYIRAISGKSPAKSKFRSVIIEYLQSPHFSKLAPRTQKDIKRTIFHEKGIDASFGELPKDAFDDPRIHRKAILWRENKWGNSRQADIAMSHLKGIVTWGRKNGLLLQNHLKDISKVYSNDRSEIFWTEAEIESFCQPSVPEHVQRILLLITETGLAPSDAVRLTRKHIFKTSAGQRIEIRRSKTGILASMPVTSKLEKLLREIPEKQDHILTKENGQKWPNPDSLGRAISKWRDRIGIRHELHLYDARGTAATRFLNAGLNVQELALAMGWTIESATRMISKYARIDPQITDQILRKLNKSSRSEE